jgi:hypothetical protein
VASATEATEPEVDSVGEQQAESEMSRGDAVYSALITRERSPERIPGLTGFVQRVWMLWISI